MTVNQTLALAVLSEGAATRETVAALGNMTVWAADCALLVLINEGKVAHAGGLYRPINPQG